MLLRSGKVKLLCGNENEFDNGGDKFKYYDLALLVDGQAYNIGCSKMAFDDAQKMGGFKDVILVCEYNPTKKTCRCVQVCDAK